MKRQSHDKRLISQASSARRESIYAKNPGVTHDTAQADPCHSQPHSDLMASFVDPATGGMTTDRTVHRFLLVNLGDDALAVKLSTWQKWIGITVIGGIIMLSWSDLVSLWLEIMEVDKQLLDHCSITWVPAPEGVAMAIAAAVKDVMLKPMSRAQGAKWLRQEARSFGSAQVNATTLSLTSYTQNQPV